MDIEGGLANRPTTGTYNFNLRQGGRFEEYAFLDTGAAINDVTIAAGKFGNETDIGGDLVITGGILEVWDDFTIGSGSPSMSGGVIVLQSHWTNPWLNITGGTIRGLGAWLFTEDVYGQDFTFDWGGALGFGLDVEGSFECANVTHINDYEGTNVLKCTNSTSFNLGGPAPGLAIEVSVDIQIIADTTCYGFDQSAGLLYFNTTDHTISVGAGGFTTAPSGLPDHSVKVAFREDGNIDVNSRTPSNLHVPAGVTVTADESSLYVGALTGAGSIVANGAGYIFRFNPAGHNWLAGWTGTISGSSHVRVYNTSYASGGSLIVTGALGLRFEGYGTDTIAWDGDLAVTNDITVAGADSGTTTINVATGRTVRCGGLKLGSDTVADNAVLSVDGPFIVTGGITAGSANASATLKLNSSRVRLSGTFDGDGVTVTNTAARIVGGTIQNVDAHLTNTLKAYRATDGGSNQNVTFRKRLGSGSGGGLFRFGAVA